MSETAFDPRTHGFGFSNRFLGGAVVAELSRQERLSELLGVTVPKGARLLTDIAGSMSFWGTFGLCGGMAWAALDRFFGRGSVPAATAPPGPGDPLFSELVRRQADSMGGQALIGRCLSWQFTPDEVPWWWFWTRGVRNMTVRREWPILKEMLDQGTPASLTLIRASGAADPSRNHQVVAIGYREEGASRQIYLYDPNHPRARPHLQLDLGANEDLQACSQSSGEPLRGFFLWPYRP